MRVDKNYCMSSYMAFRYIEDADKDFYENMHHSNIRPESEPVFVRTAQDIDRAIGTASPVYSEIDRAISMQMTEIHRGGGKTRYFPVRRDGLSHFGILYGRVRRLYLPFPRG